MVGTELLCFEAIMLNSVELFADGGRVRLSSVPYTLKVGAESLSSIRQAAAHERLEAILKKCTLILYFLIPMEFYAVQLSSQFRVGGFWTGEFFQFPVDLCYLFIVNSRGYQQSVLGI